MELTLYRRHRDDCKHRDKGAAFTKCSCPIWCDGKLDGKRVRRSVGLTDWARAVKRVEKWEEKPNTIQKVETVQSGVESFLADCAARNLGADTITSYRNTLNSLVTFCKSHGIDDLTSLDVATATDFRASLKGRTIKKHLADCAAAKLRAGRRKCECPLVTLPPTPKGQRKVLENLRGFGSFAIERDWMNRNVFAKIKPPKDDGPPAMPFTQEETETILTACDKIRNPNNGDRARLRARALLLLLLYSGFRVSDAVKLERKRLDMRTGRLLVRIMKPRKPLYLRLHPDAVAALAALPVESEYFFWSGKSELGTAIGSARRTIDCLGRMTGIHAHPHRTRDTFAVRLLEKGTDIRTVSLLLGHSSVTITERHYAPWVETMQSRLDDAIALLDFSASVPDTLVQPAMREFVN